jgi:hypothetical protein
MKCRESDDGGQTTEDRGQMTEVRGQTAEDRFHKSESKIILIAATNRSHKIKFDRYAWIWHQSIIV